MKQENYDDLYYETIEALSWLWIWHGEYAKAGIYNGDIVKDVTSKTPLSRKSVSQALRDASIFWGPVMESGDNWSTMTEIGILLLDSCYSIAGGWNPQNYRHMGCVPRLRRVAEFYLLQSDWVGVQVAGEVASVRMSDFVIFSEVARHKHISQVAKTAGLHTATISKRIKSLEGFLGCNLIETEALQVVLSPYYYGAKGVIERICNEWSELLELRERIGGNNAA